MKTCYICRSGNVSSHDVGGEFTLLSCSACGLKWIDAATEIDIASYYSQDYYCSDDIQGYRDYVSDADLHRRNAAHILAKIDSLHALKGARLLDVGCGFGFLLDEARSLYGCNCQGVEVSECGRNHAVETLGLDVLPCLDPENIGLETVDVACLVGTIEHLTDPRVVLAGMARVLRPGGLLVITTVDTKGPLPLYAIKPPEHLFYFNRANLSRMLGDMGFGTERVGMHYTWYYLHDLLHRLSVFFRIRPLGWLAGRMRRLLPGFALRIPTNEMFLVAKKDG